MTPPRARAVPPGRGPTAPSSPSATPPRDAGVLRLVAERLTASPPAAGVVASELVLAAFAGPGALSAAIAGDQREVQAQERAAAAMPAAGVRLESLEVEGFRGVGPPVEVHISPSPGLTLIAGPNGSGKSSLAEALEMLLTGSNRRWAERARVWAEGWRNLHHGTARISARFRVEGRATALTVTRTWASDAELGASTLTLSDRRGAGEDGWAAALQTFPPLLSHNQLGRILEGRPSDLYDALAAMLGLGAIASAESLLRSARLEMDRGVREQQVRAQQLHGQLAQIDDERAARAARALAGRTWDLDAADAALSTGITAVEERGALSRLRELATLPVIDREGARDVAEHLRRTAADLARLGGTGESLARQTAHLLHQALAVHAAPGAGTDCPVCGTPGVLTYAWRVSAKERARELEEQAASVEAVHRHARDLRAQALRLVSAPPPALRDGPEVGVDTAGALDRWTAWATVPEGDDLAALAAHLDTAAPTLIDAVAAVRRDAVAELERREDRWRPAAQALAAWLPQARAAQVAHARLPAVRAAESWVKDAHEDLREQRFAPIAEQVQEHWRTLRQSSSVHLGALRLVGTGTSTQRRLDLEVNVDGRDGAALGVMSQGELNCLALSLFLPRAAMPESPFRFLVIDDPVQAMDPLRVEGLARVLASVAKNRQVVVLTHDDRLPAAVRRLDIEATIVEVVRREGSVVELRQVLDPVLRYIEDAVSVARSDHLPPEARRVVPGFCRLALEAACAEAVTRRLVRAGRTLDEVDDELSQPTTLLMWLALALLEDAARAGDVMSLLNRRHPWAADAVSQCNRGAHAAVTGDLMALIRAAEQLATKIRVPAHAGA